MMEHSAPGTHEQPDLKEYLGVLMLRKWVVVGIAGLVVVAAMAFSLTRTPTYESEARVRVRPMTLSTTDDLGTILNMETERELASSSTNIAVLAADELGADNEPDELVEHLDVSLEPSTEILIFSFSDSEPEIAQAGAEAFAQAYLEDRKSQATQDLEAFTQPLRDRIAARQERLQALQAELAVTNDQTRREILQVRISSQVSRIAVIQEQLEDLAAPEELDVGQIVQSAQLPEAPSSPDHLLNFALSLFVGLGLGVGTALLAERLDDRLRGRRDLEIHSGVPVLAVIPTVRAWRKPEDPLVITIEDTESSSAEAYRTLRTGILFDAASRSNVQAVLITSPEAGEGKTTTAANLGASLANAGKRVVIVSADLRRPRLHGFFSRDLTPGLTNLLAGETRLSDALIRIPSVSNLRLLPSGPVPGNPAELLGSPAMRRVMTELRDEADFILVDAAPVLAVSDSLTLSQLVDAVVIVADADKTHRSAVDQARDELNRVGARVIGAVLNNFDPTRARTYQSYTSYASYRSEDREAPPRRRRLV